MEKENVINKYIEYLYSNNISELMNLFSANPTLKDFLNNNFNGHDQLLKYYNENFKIKPEIGKIEIEKGRYFLDTIYFDGIKRIRLYFDFDNENKIENIEMKKYSWF